ncbi:hypothetical protein [Bradyrhizobium sp.]|jgi:hypothetical protein|uniref:hypothetical protein n=1 Tax=Bradyrhizobium sp. TaxID=376 RepID=UPI003C1AC0DA
MRPKERKDRIREYCQVDVDDASDLAIKKGNPPAANDNSIAWPFYPFPDGWHAS